MKYKVFYRKNFQAGFHLTPPTVIDKELFTEVTEIEIANHPNPPERIFRLMNVVDGDELPTTLHVRSMCSGDAIEDETGQVFFCASIGFALVDWQ